MAKLRTVSTVAIFGCTIAIIIILLLTFYADKVGSITIDLDKDAFNKYGLSLSETADFREPTSRLVAENVEDAEPIGNISNYPDETLPEEILRALENGVSDGSNNGLYFLAYSFYIRNSGTMSADYLFSIQIVSSTNNLDAAIRLMVVKERDVTNLASREVQTVYAKRQGPNGLNPDAAELGTTPFLSTTEILSDLETNFNSGMVDRYTILLWLEGNDADCIDEGEASILSGAVKLKVQFTLQKEET